LRNRVHDIAASTLGVVLVAVMLSAPGCLVRHETRIRPAELPPPAQDATLADLVSKINSQGEAIHTLTATVDLEPTAGSVYSGIIREYHDVRGFILVDRPSTIRIFGLAPVVMTKVFDMVSNGEDFRLYIPPKQKFIVGKTSFHRPAKNALENLRPQHILQALVVPPIDAEHEKCILEEAEDGAHRYYVVIVVAPEAGDALTLRRKVWFDRADLRIARVQFYEMAGTYTEDVRYASYQDFQGIQYPAHLDVKRPAEDYELAITLEKCTFNQPIPAEKFELPQPPGTQLVELSASLPKESPLGQ